jgi:hypothetical protein
MGSDNSITKNKKKTNHAKGIERAKLQIRKEQALARKEEYDKLTKQQKIDALDAAFGVGLGATKERARLNKTA